MKVTSISELKNTLSAHLDRTRSGEIVVITDRNSPIATLERITPGSHTDSETRLVANGIIAPRKAPLNVAALLAMPLPACNSSLVSAILEERSNDR
jgi:antitoxin (DNA-binding transcriptional repressor) of toxin-antitoxin stability system